MQVRISPYVRVAACPINESQVVIDDGACEWGVVCNSLQEHLIAKKGLEEVAVDGCGLIHNVSCQLIGDAKPVGSLVQVVRMPLYTVDSEGFLHLDKAFFCVGKGLADVVCSSADSILQEVVFVQTVTIVVRVQESMVQIDVVSTIGLGQLAVYRILTLKRQIAARKEVIIGMVSVLGGLAQ